MNDAYQQFLLQGQQPPNPAGVSAPVPPSSKQAPSVPVPGSAIPAAQQGNLTGVQPKMPMMPMGMMQMNPQIMQMMAQQQAAYQQVLI